MLWTTHRRKIFDGDKVNRSQGRATTAVDEWRTGAAGFAAMSLTLRTVPISLWVFLAALAVYAVTLLAGGMLRQTGVVYFDELAAAFLRGELHLATPSQRHDLSSFGGRWYVPFPPLPALLLLPWVATGGVSAVNSVVFSVLCGAVSIAAVDAMLAALAGRGLAPRRWRDRVWLTALFGFGSVHWTVSILGSVWYLGQTCSVMCLAVAGWLAASGRPGWQVGAALGLAMLGRPNLMLAWPFLWGCAHLARAGGDEIARSRAWVLGSVGAVGSAGCLLAMYNFARFGSPFDFGYTHALVPPRLADDLAQHGQFDVAYLPRNLEIFFARLPQWRAGAGLTTDFEGMSVFVTTPALLFLALALRALRGLRGLRARGPRAREAEPVREFVVATWVSLGLLLLPIVSYYNTGWMQFGARFSLDLMVPAVALLGVVTRERMGWLFQAVVGVGVLVNAWGVILWLRVLRG